MKSPFPALLAAAAWIVLFTGPLRVHAQTVAPAIRVTGAETAPSPVPPPPGLPPEVAARLARPPGAPQSGETPEAPADPAVARLQALLQLQFDRRPEALLQSAASRLTAAAIPTNEVERFQFDVVAGDWPAVGRFLATLGTNDATQVFDHLVQQLMANPGQGPAGARGRPGAPPQPPVPQMPGVPPPAHFLLPDDVFGLADACPVPLTDERLQTLGQLLARTIEGARTIAPILERLDQGTATLGGHDPGSRRRAAQLLIAAGRLTDAEWFLPRLDTEAVPRDHAMLNVHASLLTAKASTPPWGAPTLVRADRLASLNRAWDVTQLLLADTNCPAAERTTAMNRALDLLPRLGAELGSNWLRSTFTERADLGASLIAHVGGAVARGMAERQPDPRALNLKRQREVIEALLDSGADLAAWRPLLAVMAAGWAREAEMTRDRPEMPQQMIQQFDPFGNPIYMGVPSPRGQNPNQPQPVPAADLLASAPGDRWLAQLDPPTETRIRVLTCQMQVKASRFDDAFSSLTALATRDGNLGRQLAADLLNGWAEARQPSRQNFYPQRVYYPGMYQPPTGIPLTRARQERNLDELAGLLARLRTLPIPPPESSVLVAAFTRAHSNAEVFQTHDIERVFGPIASIDAATLAELLQTMRSRLATAWRQPRVQQEARTRRTDQEIAAEVGRGYQLVVRLAEAALESQPRQWRLMLARAAAHYDWAEFDYGQKVDLAVYTGRRDEAFRLFEESARIYAEEVPKLEESAQVPLVYQQWFNATLGAADLSYLTRQTEPSTNQLARIRAAILALPGDAADRHLAAFGRELSDSAGGLRPELKPRYARAGLQVVGDHPAAKEAQDLVRHYDDLLREIVLDLRVDGDTVVGHTRPFGVFVSILHTDAVGRESGGFARYLQNPGNRGYYYNPYGGGPQNYRDEFEKQVAEKFTDGFEVITVTFHDEKVEARGADRAGWRVFPYAYLLLRAKDASTDTLPSLQLSMDFLDPKGQVVLPVASAPVLIDARPVDAPPRPARKIEIVQTLDDRELAAGSALLEIKATARGLVPELDRLLEVRIPGFRIARTEDRGLTLAEMDTEDAVAPVTERFWVLTLAPEDKAAEGLRFAFPTARSADIQVSYKRYADADLVEVPAELAMAGLPLRPDHTWMWVAGGVALLAGGGTWWLRRRTRDETVPEAPAYALPAEITPFSVLHLLERLQRDQALTWSPEQRRELIAAVSDLQRAYFDRTTHGDHPPAPTLQSVAERWVSRVPHSAHRSDRPSA